MMILSIRNDLFYIISNDDHIIYDYGKIIDYRTFANAQILPYGGTKAYDVYGYDENGYDNKGYKTDGYNDAGYDREGYNKAGYNAAGYNRDGYKTDGYNDAGYDKDGYMRDGYNDAGYDRDGYDRDGFNAKGYDRDGYDRDGYDKYGYDEAGYDKKGYDKKGYDHEGYDKHGYNKNGFGRDGYNKYGFDKDYVCKDGYVYTQGDKIGATYSLMYTRIPYKPWYIHGLTKWNRNGKSAFEDTFNFNIADLDKIKKSYSGCGSKIATIAYSKKYTKNKHNIRSGVLYISMPESYVKQKCIITITHYGNIIYNKHFTVKKTNYRFKFHDGDHVAIWTQKVDAMDVAYKFVPSTNKLKKTTYTVYNGKMIAADKTNVTLKANKVVKNDVYLANIDARNVTVSTSNTGIVKVSKTNKLSNTYCQLKLTGGSKSGTATVTIKDKKSGKTQKITVTNK